MSSRSNKINVDMKRVFQPGGDKGEDKNLQKTSKKIEQQKNMNRLANPSQDAFEKLAKKTNIIRPYTAKPRSPATSSSAFKSIDYIDRMQ